MKSFKSALLGIMVASTVYAQSPDDFKNPLQKFRPEPLWFWNNTAITREGIGADTEDLPFFLSAPI